VPLSQVLAITYTDVLLAFIPGILAGIAYFHLVSRLAYNPGDYTAHELFARYLVEKGIIFSPACLFHFGVAALVRAGSTYPQAAVIVTVGAYGLTSLLLYLVARQMFRTSGVLVSRSIALIFAIAAPLVQPISRQMYQIGFIYSEPYLSPTYALMKPFALLSAAFVVYFLRAPRRSHWSATLACAFAAIASTMAKPSFAICAVPSSALLAAFSVAKKKPFSMAGVIGGFLIPAVAVLGWQLLRTYQPDATLDTPDYRDSIVFAPLKVMRLYATGLSLKYLLSGVGPFCVLVFYFRRAWSDSGVRFATCALVFGAAYTYLFAEKLRLGAGNFLWSSYISMFILNVFALLFLLRQMMVDRNWRLIPAVICASGFMWQIESGFRAFPFFGPT
jgi:hypothetical protein